MKHQSNILALKYRPLNFQDLIGQEYLVETIQKSIQQNKIPNAYIFTGIRGVGKTTTAKIVAKIKYGFADLISSIWLLLILI